MTTWTRTAAALALILGAGCATRPVGTVDNADRTYRQLVQAAGPSRAIPDWPPPPGVPAELASPVSPGERGDADATRGLDATIDELSRRAVADPATPGRDPTPEEAQSALRLYISGREKLTGGDNAGAVSDLRAAVRLDPGSPEPWRELACALRAVGSDAEAYRAFENAASRGMNEAPGLEYLGRVRQERAETVGEPAAIAFAHAWVLGPRGSDLGLPAVLLAGLARSLMEMERWTAAREAIEVSLRELDRVTGPSRYGRDLADLARLRGAMWRSIGDLACRVGDYTGARRAYERAEEFPSVEDLGLTPRIVFAATRAEGPAAGAAYLIARARAGNGLSDTDVELLRLLARDGSARGRIVAALTALRDAEGGSRRRGAFTRALAAVQAPADALRELAARAEGHPEDGATLRQLARPDFGPSGLDALVRVVRRHPLSAPAVADALYAERADVDATLAELDPRHAEAGLVRVYLEAHRGRLGAALAEADRLPESGPLADAAAVARVTALASLGMWDRGERELSRMDPRRGDESRRAAAVALHAMHRYGAASRVLEPLVSQGREEDLLLASELALAGRETPQVLDSVEAWLSRVREVDPGSERAHAMLLSLYAASGPRADAAKLADAVRSLRETSEGGRLLGLLRAQELARRGSLREAEAILLDLAREAPADQEIMDLLASVWEAPAPPGTPREVEPVAWLSERHAERPSDPVLTTALARVLVAAGKPDEAESLVRERLAAGDDPRLGSTLETVLRKRPGGGEEADRMALARLEPMPRSIDACLELSELYARLDRPSDAARVLVQDIPGWATLGREQTQRLVRVAGTLTQRAQNDPTSANKSAARSLLDALVQRQVEVASELHALRLSLMAEDASVTPEQIEAALRLVEERYPRAAAPALMLTADVLSTHGRKDDAARLIERAAGRAGAGVDVFFAWVRLVAQAGTADDARRLIERAGDAGQLAALAARLSGGDPAARDPRAEAAYQIGLAAGGLGRREQAESMYELALTYDPGHAWACNNLGYALADRGEQLDRAEVLLERAYAGLPGEGSILDSLAWVRYRRGEVADSKDAGGNTTQGALTLLTRAYQTRGGRESPVVLDHYADTLYSQGRKDEARRVWGESLRAAAQRLRAMNGVAPNDPSRQEMLEMQRNVRAKLDAVRAGAEVPYDAPGAAPRAPAAPQPADESGGN